MIECHFTESGFAFAVMPMVVATGPMVTVYDLEHREVPIPGDPEVMGRFLRSYRLAWLLEQGPVELRVQHHGFRPLVVPAACMVRVIEFLVPG